MQRLVARLAAAVLVTAAATVVLPGAPAQAAYCSGSGGVSVLVDYGDLGGGTATGCGTGSTADKAFDSAGAQLTADADQTTFVCRVKGKPSEGSSCTATDAYWGFFISDDGKPWRYASLGVYSQPVDAGDSVALVWQSSSGRRVPGQGPADVPTTTPTTKAPVKTPTRAPSAVAGSGRTTKAPKPKPTKNPTPTAAVTLAPAPSVSATASVSASGSASVSGTPSATGSAASEPTTSVPSTSDGGAASTDLTPAETDAATEPTASDSGGLPGWVPPLLLAVVAVAAGGVAWVRRTR